MKAFFIFLIVILSVFYLAVLFFAIKSRKFIKTLLLNAALGVCVLAVIDFTAKFTGIFIPVNLYSVAGSGAFGVPAVCGFLIMQIVFI